jgi:hypothetical protein
VWAMIRQEAQQPQWALWCPLQNVIVMFGHFDALVTYHVALLILVLRFFVTSVQSLSDAGSSRRDVVAHVVAPILI